MNHERIRLVIATALIILAATVLSEPWMIALQAAMGGFQFGVWLERLGAKKSGKRQ